MKNRPIQSQSRRAVIAAIPAASALALLPFQTANAQASAQIPIVDFFRESPIARLALSPDGKSIAAIRQVNGRANLTIVDLSSKRAKVITNYSDADIGGFRWVSSDRLVFSLFDSKRGAGDQISGGLFAIDKDAENYRELSERSGYTEGKRLLPAGATLHSRIRGKYEGDADIVVQLGSLQAVGVISTSLVAVNTKTGRSFPMTVGGPTGTRAWVVDRANVARAAVVNEADTTKLFYRSSATSDWRLIAQASGLDQTRLLTPLMFDKQGVLYAAGYLDKNYSAIYKFDDTAGRFSETPFFSKPDTDILGGLIVRSGEIVGVSYELDKPRVDWLVADLRTLQADLDKALPGVVNSFTTRGDGDDEEINQILVTSFSDRSPTRWYVYDPKSKGLTQVAASRQWLDPAKLSPTQFLRYRARDGLEIPAQLTIPAGSDGKNLPVVVLHYGGPWVRAIRFGFDPIVQFLSSRGYAVFMPAPRGSTGWGYKHGELGIKQWGLGMQDDVTDGVQALIKSGVVDPKRVCIAGASYGGYLTMMGLVKEPQMFKCGINWVGVTDPLFMLTVTWTDFNRIGGAGYTLERLIGHPEKDAAQFAQTSPLRRAKEINQPVLMAYGALDERVPLINGTRMRDALAGHNKNVEWVVYPDEGHNWVKLETNVDFFTRMEKFLAANL